jgi:hypothetical protein
MNEAITMSREEQRRSWVISRLAAGELGVTEAARALRLSLVAVFIGIVLLGALVFVRWHRRRTR